MSIANNIAAFRDMRGWARPELAKRMGTSTQQIERLEKGQRGLTTDWIEKAANALGVPPGDIITPGAASGDHFAPDHQPTLKAEDGSVSLRHLDMSLSMGDGSNIDDYFEEGVFEFDANLLRTISRAPSHRLIVGHGIGDSMQPTLHDRDMVIFDTTQIMLNATDKIWAISLFGAGGIKRLRPIARDRVLIISDNPTLENQEVSTEDLRILGRVIWSARRH
jgi:transcriptional regulator with XRE-family HTH domain